MQETMQKSTPGTTNKNAFITPRARALMADRILQGCLKFRRSLWDISSFVRSVFAGVHEAWRTKLMMNQSHKLNRVVALRQFTKNVFIHYFLCSIE